MRKWFGNEAEMNWNRIGELEIDSALDGVLCLAPPTRSLDDFDAAFLCAVDGTGQSKLAPPPTDETVAAGDGPLLEERRDRWQCKGDRMAAKSSATRDVEVNAPTHPHTHTHTLKTEEHIRRFSNRWVTTPKVAVGFFLPGSQQGTFPKQKNELEIALVRNFCPSTRRVSFHGRGHDPRLWQPLISTIGLPSNWWVMTHAGGSRTLSDSLCGLVVTMNISNEYFLKKFN